jgi:uncharacterized membrane protein YgcG
VDTTETQDRQGGNGKAPPDNVVRLPRDWLGPREELVPFGPPTPPASAEESGPLSAHDFWGGGESTVASEDIRSSSHKRARFLRRASRRSFVWARRIRDLRSAKAGLGLAAVVLLAVGLFVATAGQPSPVFRPQARQDLHASSELGPPAPAIAALERQNRSAEHAAQVKAARRAREIRLRRQAAARRARRANRARTPARTTPPSVQTVRYTAPASSAASQPASTSAAAAAPSTSNAAATSSPSVSSPAPASTASSGSSGAGSSGAGSSGAGSSGGGSSTSTNQPAIGANGTLSPGSSPDS